MFNYLKAKFGRGSKIDKLIRRLPNSKRVLAAADRWAELTRDWGDRLAAWEPQEARLLTVIRDTANTIDLLDNSLPGAEKRDALFAQLRMAAAAVGIGDAAFDKFWAQKARPLLDAYIARIRA